MRRQRLSHRGGDWRRAATAAVLVFAAVLAASCGAPAAAVEPTPGPASTEASPAIQACLRDLEASMSRDGLVGAGAPAAAASCAQPFGASECGAAWRAAREVGTFEAHGAAVAACRPGYCASLPEPRPELCTAAQAMPPGIGLLVTWMELHLAVLERALDPDRARLILGFVDGAGPRWGQPIVLGPPAPPPPPRGALVVRVSVAGAGAQVTVVGGGGGPWIIAPAPAALAADLTPALARLPGKPRVVLQMDGDVTYGVVVRLIDALREAGFVEVTLAVLP